jgi:hypothetical protein
MFSVKMFVCNDKCEWSHMLVQLHFFFLQISLGSTQLNKVHQNLLLSTKKRYKKGYLQTPAPPEKYAVVVMLAKEKTRGLCH